MKYGPIFSLQILGGRVVVVNGYKLMREVLVKRGEDYADRPGLPILYDVIGTKGIVCCIALKNIPTYFVVLVDSINIGKNRNVCTIHTQV